MRSVAAGIVHLTPSARADPLIGGGDLARAVAAATSRTPRLLHVCRERDVGLFSLVQQVISNVPWALHEGRVPVVHFGARTSYWTPAGHQGASTVWEYYFEPVIEGFPTSVVPESIHQAIEHDFPEQTELGRRVGAEAFVSNHFGDHPALAGVAPAIPYTTGDPSAELRAWTGAIIHSFVRPRAYLRHKANAFFAEHIGGQEVIGVHVRGTDAVSKHERRDYRQGSLDLQRFARAIADLLREQPHARVLVATDAEASLTFLRDVFGDSVVAYDAVRHGEGEPAGQGPTGCIMPAYVAADRDRAAQNGEDAVVEYLLLSRCSHLVHNGASLAVTALLGNPALPHTNTRRPVT